MPETPLPLPTPSSTLVRWLIEQLAVEAHPESHAAREDLRRRLVGALAGPPRQFRTRLRRTTTPKDLQLLVDLARWHEALAKVSPAGADAAETSTRETALAIRYRSAAQLLALLDEVPLSADASGGDDRR